MIKHYNITVSGKVQGVFYRASTKHKAEELGITGFVRNEPSGIVYIEAEGQMAQLSALIDWCKIGPKHARVENVHFYPGDIMDFEGFAIR
ncbi:MAG TPA: acylphosphatase [Fulvivirga sp.]|nr:acylphosphatase [Fulvivirga sp.]